MVSILYGENDFMIKQKQQSIVSSYLSEAGSDIGLERFDATVEPQNLWQSITAQPFLVSHKLIVLDKPSESSKLADFVIEKLDEVIDSVHLLIVEGKLDRRTQYYKTIRKHEGGIEMPELTEPELLNWLIEAAANLKLKLERRLAQRLISRAGQNQWRLYRELQKLAPLGKVSAEGIDNLVEADPRDTIFMLLDTLASGNREQADSLYTSLRAQRLEPHYIMSMIIWQVQNILLVALSDGASDQQIAKDAGLNPYVVRKTRLIADKVNKPRLKSIVKLVVETDEQLKSTKINADDAVRLLLFKIGSYLRP